MPTVTHVGHSLSSLGIALLVSLGGASCSSDTGEGSVAPLDHETAAEACARIVSCADLRDKSSTDELSICTALLLGTRGEMVVRDDVEQCVRNAADCEAVTQCLNAGEANDVCDPNSYDSSCEGDVGRRCFGVVVALDCGKRGLDCVEDSIGQLHCGQQGECTDATCTEDGEQLICVNSVMVQQSCRGDGECVVDDAGNAVCTGGGEACGEPIHRCEGDVAVSCQNGRVSRMRCAKCMTGDGAFCVADTECQTSSCDGSTLEVCLDGRRYLFDCEELGFSGCQDDNGTVQCVP